MRSELRPLRADQAKAPSGRSRRRPLDRPRGPAVREPGRALTCPNRSPSQAATLKRLGLTLDPALLADPLSRVLGAVVNFGGCSASFVSSDGLLVTNHHCATGALQYNSTPEKNLLKDGFTARVASGRALRSDRPGASSSPAG